MPRPITNSFRRAIEAEASGRIVLVALIFEHDELDKPIRVINDTRDFLIGGERYFGAPFQIELVSDTDGTPEARLSVQNVDRRVGLAVEGLTGSPTVTARIYDSGDFDLTVDPRTPTGTPDVEYEAGDLEFVEIEITSEMVGGSLILRDYGAEPWPKTLATQDMAPGLFL